MSVPLEKKACEELDVLSELDAFLRQTTDSDDGRAYSVIQIIMREKPAALHQLPQSMSYSIERKGITQVSRALVAGTFRRRMDGDYRSLQSACRRTYL